jgi:LacI family transcriptional regulator
MSTIRDVAKLAGVGLGTASRAISGKGVVSSETQAKVEQAVRTLNFSPSKVARSLSLKSQKLVGVYFPSFEGTYFAPILQAIEKELRAQDLHMVTATYSGTGTLRERALQGMQFLIERQCDGVLVLDTYTLDADLKAFRKMIPHMVVVNRLVPGMVADSFPIDHDLAGRMAAKSLIERGHRRFAVLHSERHSVDVNVRIHSFKAQLQASWLPSPREFFIEGLLTFPHAWEASEQLVQDKKPDFTALFCATDVVAMAAMSRMQSAGFSIPGQISVLGYDDAEMAAYTYPSLSTVHIPSKETAVNACRRLLNRAFGLDLPVIRRFEPQMVWRDSVRSLTPASQH